MQRSLGDSLRRNAFGITLVLSVALVAAAAGYFTADTTPSRSARPAPPPPFVLRGVVQDLSGDSLRLSTDSGNLTLKLGLQTPVEALQPAVRSTIRPGDWLNVGAGPHAQTLFFITGIVLIPAELLEGPR